MSFQKKCITYLRVPTQQNTKQQVRLFKICFCSKLNLKNKIALTDEPNVIQRRQRSAIKTLPEADFEWQIDTLFPWKYFKLSHNKNLIYKTIIRVLLWCMDVLYSTKTFSKSSIFFKKNVQNYKLTFMEIPNRRNKPSYF